jgi:hypothetical protein
MLDLGDMTVKGFTPDGEYVTTYRRGNESAPGQFAIMADV